jgi:hypothetical protein
MRNIWRVPQDLGLQIHVQLRPAVAAVHLEDHQCRKLPSVDEIRQGMETGGR